MFIQWIDVRALLIIQSKQGSEKKEKWGMMGGRKQDGKSGLYLFNFNAQRYAANNSVMENQA